MHPRRRRGDRPLSLKRAVIARLAELRKMIDEAGRH
jgi:hypothetical protein